ncbi:unnamed protein product [Orchesella dallaii]|uniref:MBT domain-containing protein 1 n=1 Tax=Orchesella dallaii TaxID=48710 RepID=A0ABP1QIH6_9HEXA
MEPMDSVLPMNAVSPITSPSTKDPSSKMKVSKSDARPRTVSPPSGKSNGTKMIVMTKRPAAKVEPVEATSTNGIKTGRIVLSPSDDLKLAKRMTPGICVEPARATSTKKRNEVLENGTKTPMSVRPRTRRSATVSKTDDPMKSNGLESLGGESIPESQRKPRLVNGRKKTRSDADGGPYTLFRQSGGVADWDVYLKDVTAAVWVAPVDYFKHAPFASKWKQFCKVGVQVELPHPRGISRVYCVGTIRSFVGYKALVQMENLSRNSRKSMAWISFCSNVPKHLGYSIHNSKLLLPNDAPELVSEHKKDDDFIALNKKFLEHIFNKPELNTISERHVEIVREELEEKQSLYSITEVVEVMDKEDPVRNRLATIIGIVGDRIVVRYLDADPDDEGFCFNMNSELVHPLGWSHCVGQSLKRFPKSMYTFKRISKNSFPKYPSDLKIKVDMVFELRHPCNPYKMVAGRVYKKLNFGYFVAKIETNDSDDQQTFVFHVTSDYILPCGFCSRHNIPLAVPEGEDEECFNWSTYCKINDVQPLGLEKVYPKSAYKFVKGVKLEAVDLCQPLYFGPATVANVADHLLYLHFDGWPCKADFYQWVSAFSPDIYPAGWAEMVGHSFQSHAKPPYDVDHYYIANCTSSS